MGMVRSTGIGTIVVSTTVGTRGTSSDRRRLVDTAIFGGADGAGVDGETTSEASVLVLVGTNEESWEVSDDSGSGSLGEGSSPPRNSASDARNPAITARPARPAGETAARKILRASGTVGLIC